MPSTYTGHLFMGGGSGLGAAQTISTARMWRLAARPSTWTRFLSKPWKLQGAFCCEVLKENHAKILLFCFTRPMRLMSDKEKTCRLCWPIHLGSESNFLFVLWVWDTKMESQKGPILIRPVIPGNWCSGTKWNSPRKLLWLFTLCHTSNGWKGPS